MSMVHTFSVSKGKGGPSFEDLKLTVGSNPSDEAWHDLGMDEQAVNQEAIKSVTIMVQGMLRRKWPSNAEQAQKMVDKWQKGRRVAFRPRLDKEKQKELKYTPEQSEHLKSIGVDVEDV